MRLTLLIIRISRFTGLKFRLSRLLWLGLLPMVLDHLEHVSVDFGVSQVHLLTQMLGGSRRLRVELLNGGL